MQRCRLHLITYLIVLLLLLGFSTGSSIIYAQGLDDYIPGEVLVKLVDPVDLAAVATTFALDPTPISQFGSRPILNALSARHGHTLGRVVAQVVSLGQQ